MLCYIYKTTTLSLTPYILLDRNNFSKYLEKKLVRNETDNTVNYKCQLETTYTSFSVPISQNSKS